MVRTLIRKSGAQTGEAAQWLWISASESYRGALSESLAFVDGHTYIPQTTEIGLQRPCVGCVAIRVVHFVLVSALNCEMACES